MQPEGIRGRDPVSSKEGKYYNLQERMSGQFGRESIRAERWKFTLDLPEGSFSYTD